MSHEEDVDYIKRDGKVIPDEEGAFLPKMAAAALVSYTVGLPIALLSGVYQLGKLAASKASSSNKPVTAAGTPKFVYPPVGPSLVENLKPVGEREFDVIMYGATGFTGGLCAQYLAKQYKQGDGIKWAIAGRRAEALERVKAQCVELNPDCADLVVFSGVDSSNEASLHAMCAQTRVVISTVGPFQLYGTPLVRACISNGTSYCDITGEMDWVVGLIESYSEAAKQAGSKIVNFCGHDCIPWDLTAYLLAQRLKPEGLKSVHFEDHVNSSPSGGTLATMLESVSAIASGQGFKSQLGFNPVLLSDQGTKSEFRTKDKSRVGPVKDAHSGEWGGPFVMAMVNCQVVGRSNALNGYGQSLEYSEARAAPSGAVLVGRYLQLAMFGPILMLPEALRQKVLPPPGQGPSSSRMDAGFLQVTGTAVGEQGTTARARMYFPTDPGYRDTARMLVESGLSIAKSPERCLRQGGVLTSATCCPEVLLERLQASGTEFSFLSSQ